MPSLTGSKPRRDELDWKKARERLERARVNGSRIDDAERTRILTERARALARRPLSTIRSTVATRDSAELLQFRLGSERYAIESHFVHRVVRPCELTRLPGAPSHLRGVTSLRGLILPVFDLREWFEVDRVAAADGTRWLVLGESSEELCLWADEVEELTPIDLRELGVAERGAGRGLVRAITNEARTVLDGSRLLAHPELVVGETPNVGQEVAS
jgi:purine-binding chemotaxis protein CheW